MTTVTEQAMPTNGGFDDLLAKHRTVQKPKPQKKEKIVEPLTSDGMVIYTDAGARPNPGFAGWGFHGYVYSETPAKKGSGNSDVYLTNRGYANKSETPTKPVEVTPLKYLDGVGSIPQCTNNVGEIVAMSEGLRHAYHQGVKKVLLLADSRYAIEGATMHLPSWERNNWVKSDGTELKNVDSWMNLSKALKMLRAANVDIHIDKVKAHSTDVGNNLADGYATLGVFSSRAGNQRQCIATTPAEGYWGKGDHHPFLSLKYAYFITHPDHNVKGEYYLGDHGKDDDVMGKRDPDTGYAYVRLDEPDAMLEYARDYLIQNAPTVDCLVNVVMSTLYSQSFCREVNLLDRMAMIRVGHRFDAQTVRKEPVIKELYPPKIAIRAVEAVNHLKGMLSDWANNPQTKLVSTDITDLLFDKTPKGTRVLGKHFVPGYTAVKVSALYEKTSEEKDTTEVELLLGVDLPERNALKRIEDTVQNVTLVTMREDGSIRFATIVKTSDAIGIWAGYYANLKLVK